MKFRLLIFSWLVLLAGCHGGRAGSGTTVEKTVRRSQGPQVRRVVCLFDQRPWLNCDAAGDRDPEGVRFRVFLDTDQGRGVLRDGKFHVEMYKIKHSPSGELERELVSAWHYPTEQFNTVSAKILGEGYHVQLRWHDKNTAGHEIELITKYEAPDGHVIRAATVRKRVPRYSS